MEQLNVNFLSSWYLTNFESGLKGRRILFSDIFPLLNKLPSIFKKEIVGYSENNIPIYQISIGKGATKILLWSQMHGNESTGTKALFDLFKFFSSEEIEAKKITNQIIASCTIKIIVMLNPDGAILFTRENANKIDLNRDAVDRKAVESRVLRNVIDSFKPQFCFNLHDQRSIFNVENTPNPATISFLAPSEDVERTITAGRKITMSVIVAMNELLQQFIPNQVGRYTDEYYPTATGDNFQKLGYNTILIEAGHFKDDYSREITRKFNFIAILQGINFIATEKFFKNYTSYFKIPNNDKKYLDIIYKNIKDDEDNVIDVGVQIKFKVIANKLVTYECIEQKGKLIDFYANTIRNGKNLNLNELKLSNS